MKDKIKNAELLYSGEIFKNYTPRFKWIAEKIRDMLFESEREIKIATYVLGDVDEILDLLFSKARKGVRIKLIVNFIDEHHPRHSELKNNLPTTFEFLEFSKKYNDSILHAKIIVVDRRKAIIGSMNLSSSGLITNNEIGIYLEGPVVEDIAYLLDLL